MVRSSEASERRLLPYFDVAGTVFYGMQTLLADQVVASRRTAAVIWLRKYTGLEPGYEPMIAMAEERFREKLSIWGYWTF